MEERWKGDSGSCSNQRSAAPVHSEPNSGADAESGSFSREGKNTHRQSSRRGGRGKLPSSQKGPSNQKKVGSWDSSTTTLFSKSSDTTCDVQAEIQRYIRRFRISPTTVLTDKSGGNFNVAFYLPVPCGSPILFEGLGTNFRKARLAAMSKALSYIEREHLGKSLGAADAATLPKQGALAVQFTKKLEEECEMNKKNTPDAMQKSSESIQDTKSGEQGKKNRKPRCTLAEVQNITNLKDISGLGLTQSWFDKGLGRSALMDSAFRMGYSTQSLYSASQMGSLRNAGWCGYSNSNFDILQSTLSSSSCPSGRASSQKQSDPGNVFAYDSLGRSYGNTQFPRDNGVANGDPFSFQKGSADSTGAHGGRWTSGLGTGSQRESSMDDIISTHPHQRRVEIPQNLDQKKFIEYYFIKVGCQVPASQVYENRTMKNSNKFDNQTWTIVYDVPPHKLETKTVSFSVEGSGGTKKRATDAARARLLEKLLEIVSEKFVENFHASTMPFKKRVERIVQKPVSISFPASTVLRLRNLVRRMQDLSCFSVYMSRTDDNATLYYINSNKSQFTHPHVQDEIPFRLEDVPEFHPPKVVLPVHSMYAEIIQAIERNPVVIVSAQTGAGKTTQVPQFILDYYSSIKNTTSRRKPLVICTQPRRIAAISVAEVVAQERAKKPGGTTSVGYSVRFANKPPNQLSPDGTILFCTSGILLSHLQSDPNLEGFTHIILDEVHERDLNTDLLLVITRHLLAKRSDLRLILMSATADTDVFMDYFRGYGTVGTKKMPEIIKVPGRMYPVEEFYLEDVVSIIQQDKSLFSNFSPPADQYEWVNAEIAGASTRFREDPLPYDYLEALIVHVCMGCEEGAILVFIPGWQEIRVLHNLLQEDRYKVGFSNPKLYEIHSLHSSIPITSQTLVFKRPPPGCRKIVLATSIAETSITINDVVFVIDLGKVKVNTYNPDCRISSLKSQCASISNVHQRMGRAGRTKPGKYYSFISRIRKKSLPYAIPPEMLRVDLQQVALLIKSLRLSRRVKDVFALAPNPPSPSSIDTVLRQLVILGALDENEHMTPLGKFICRLALDPWIAKMVIMGTILGCMDSMVTIAALMETSRSLYHITLDNKEVAWRHIVTNFAGDTYSDQLTALNAFRRWLETVDGSEEGRYLVRGRGDPDFSPKSHIFAHKNCLNYPACVNVKKHRNHLLKTLSASGLLKSPSRGEKKGKNAKLSCGIDAETFRAYNENDSDTALVRSVLAGALYPNISEIRARDEYRTFTDRFLLRLTTTCVNSWRSILMIKNAEYERDASQSTFRENGEQSSKSSIAPGIKSSRGLRKADSTTTGDMSSMMNCAPASPVRLVVFQQKQQLDNSCYLRQVTKACPIALCLFANFEKIELCVNEEDDSKMLLIDDVLYISLNEEEKCLLLIELRDWFNKYLEWAVWNRCTRMFESTEEEPQGQATYFGSDRSYDNSDQETENEYIHGGEPWKPAKSDPEQEKLGLALLREIVSLVAATEEDE